MPGYHNKSAKTFRFALVLGVLFFLSVPAFSQVPAPPVTSSAPQVQPAITRPDIGFATPQKLHDHFRKHGGEFGKISKKEYLRLARELRDRPAGGDILEAVRKDGVVTRFDRKSGAFLAFNPDATIRTFFRPNDGERYFWRQAGRSPKQ